MTKGKTLLQIFWTFLKIGALTFGGGYAMIPIIEKEFVDNHGFISRDDIVDIFALAQSAPGAIAINSSMFIGFKVAGTHGSLVATLGMMIPSYVIITLIAIFSSHFFDLPVVQRFFGGIRAAIIALILISAIRMAKKTAKHYIGLVIILITAILVFLFNLNPILLVFASVIFGLLSYFLLRDRMIELTKEGGR